MQSHLILHLVAAVTEIVSASRLPHFCSWPIEYALAHLTSFPEGQILRQSFSHYLAHMELFEYLLYEKTNVSFSLESTSIFMFFILEGHSSLYDKKEKFISKVESGACHIGFSDKGRYNIKLEEGEHKLLVLTLRPDWFIRKAENLGEFKPLLAHYLAKRQSLFVLPYCPINRDIIRPLRRLLLQKAKNLDNLEALVNSILIQLIGQYNKMLENNKYITTALHEIKATELANYVQENFTDNTVEYIPGMAQKFNVSERLLFKLAQIAFNKSIREHVIDLRMNYALLLLETTNDSIHEIAFLVGYNDPGYFSKAFKKYHNKSAKRIKRPIK